MMDFALDESYDIILDPIREIPRFKLDFSLSENPKFLLQFDVHDERQDVIPTLPHFKIEFITENLSDTTLYTVPTISRLKEVVQALQIRLKTELSEIQAENYQSFGSELVRTKHQDLVNDDTLEAIKTYTENAIRDVLDKGFTVQVLAEDNDTAGYFYCQHVSIYIYDKTGIILYTFSIW